MKKLFTILLTLVFVMSMGSAVFATAPTQPVNDNYVPDLDSIGPFTDMSSITISKVLDIVNDGTVNPGETFYFEIGAGTFTRTGLDPLEGVDFNTDTDPDTFTITVGEGLTESTASIVLPPLTTLSQVGVYSFPVTEVAGDTAGMNYDGKTYYLVITVLNNPNYDPDAEPEDTDPPFLRVLTFLDPGLDVKTDAFDNSFEAGNLTVDKVIAGNYADPDDEFEITVTVTPDELGEGFYNIKQGPIVWGDTTEFTTEATTGVITAVYTLKGGESFTIENLPYDVTYTVTEVPATGYTPAGEVTTPAPMDSSLEEVTITNTRNTTVDTGISLDSLPYILLLIAAVAGMGVLFAKKRKNTDF